MVDQKYRVLRYYSLLQRVNAIAFCVAMPALLFGLMISTWWEDIGLFLFKAGFLTLGVLLFESYFVLPRLKCPRCGLRFFVPNVWYHWFLMINPFNRRCVSCELSLGERPGEQAVHEPAN